MTDVLAGREETIPAFARLTVCCSMASSRACCWFPILSNSSIQHTPGVCRQREKKEAGMRDGWGKEVVSVQLQSVVVFYLYTPNVIKVVIISIYYMRIMWDWHKSTF